MVNKTINLLKQYQSVRKELIELIYEYFNQMGEIKTYIPIITMTDERIIPVTIKMTEKNVLGIYHIGELYETLQMTSVDNLHTILYYYYKKHGIYEND